MYDPWATMLPCPLLQYQYPVQGRLIKLVCVVCALVVLQPNLHKLDIEGRYPIGRLPGWHRKSYTVVETVFYGMPKLVASVTLINHLCHYEHGK